MYKIYADEVEVGKRDLNNLKGFIRQQVEKELAERGYVAGQPKDKLLDDMEQINEAVNGKAE